jgi:hypothetical protein
MNTNILLQSERLIYEKGLRDVHIRSVNEINILPPGQVCNVYCMQKLFMYVHTKSLFLCLSNFIPIINSLCS